MAASADARKLEAKLMACILEMPIIKRIPDKNPFNICYFLS